MEVLSKTGAIGFTDDGIPILNEEILREALRRAAKLHMPVSLHEEDPAYITNNGINTGKVRQCKMMRGGFRENMPALPFRLPDQFYRLFRADMLNRKVRPFLLCKPDIPFHHVDFRFSGRIATDHAPHSAEEKEKPITEAPSGIIGLETAFEDHQIRRAALGQIARIQTI